MLAEIRIDRLGVISRAQVGFHRGFTALTGETGAGKTMVVTGLRLLGGVRSDAAVVRAGAAKAVVEGRFIVDGLSEEDREEVSGAVDAAGAEMDEDGSVIAVRSVGRDGRSRAHLGGRSVPIGVLGRFTGQLLAIHGQNDQLRLLRPERRRAELDRYGGERIAALREEYRAARAEYGVARAELADRTGRARELAQEADLLRLGLDEVGAADPQPGEDETVAAEVRRLSDLDSLREAAQYIHGVLSGAGEFSGTPESSGVVDLIASARARLDQIDDPALGDFAPRIDELSVLAGDLAGDVGGYLSGLPADGDALEGLLQRQAELKALTRKYAADIDGVIEWARDARERLAGMDVSSEALAELEHTVVRLRVSLADAAVRLHDARVAAADDMSRAVTAELGGLAMGASRLEARVEYAPASEGDEWAVDVGSRDGADGGRRPGRWLVHAGPDGVDEVDLLLAAHPGADAAPIGKVASGGELSRVMLAFEVVLAGRDGGGTFVFDEVDAGIGGKAAVEIGRRLAQLSRTHQVIVVTHLPQVAAFADTHLVVGKEVGEADATSAVRELGDAERVVELARMLSGLDDTETGRAHAEELLATASGERGL